MFLKFLPHSWVTGVPLAALAKAGDLPREEECFGTQGPGIMLSDKGLHRSSFAAPLYHRYVGLDPQTLGQIDATFSPSRCVA